MRQSVNLPPQLPLGQYQRHQRQVGAHAERPQAEDDAGLKGAARVAVERLRVGAMCRVRRRPAPEA
jgi:hypothetical protein